ncbi:MAG: hypothetical protein ACKOOI_12490, partial [Pirellula sp.]
MKWFQGAFGGESFGTFEREFGFAEGLLSDSDFADDFLTFGEERAVEVFLSSDDRFVDGGIGADDGGFCGANDDALVLGFLLEGRGVELAKGVPFFDHGSFGDDRE